MELISELGVFHAALEGEPLAFVSVYQKIQLQMLEAASVVYTFADVLGTEEGAFEI